MKSTNPCPTLPKVRNTMTFSASVTDELHRFDTHLRDVQGLALGTRKINLRVVGCFLQDQFGENDIEIGRLCPDDIRQFFARQLGVGNRSASYASSLSAGLHGYFRYRATCGDPTGHLSTATQNPVHWKLASLPRALAPEESDRLLDAVPRIARRHPKRGYAIVRCALDLGLRCGEIAHLGLADIDWRNGTVVLRGTKTKRQDVLPLPMETGQALADYLQHERPASKHPSLFVRQIDGQDVPLTPMAICKFIKRACCGVGLPEASAHSLRHTVASRLVANGSSLKEVADLLRHRSLETTLIYAKLDTPKLAAVALPWPGSQP
jgi:integrase